VTKFLRNGSIVRYYEEGDPVPVPLGQTRDQPISESMRKLMKPVAALVAPLTALGEVS
jgi:hypothetical protein